MKFTCFASALMVVTILSGELHAAGGDLEPEKWSSARTLVWTLPGKWVEYASTADYHGGKIGRPTKKPPDKNTDLILPDAPDGQTYIVGYFNGGRRHNAYNEPPGLFCRHITIGKGAGLDGGARSSRGKIRFSGHADLDAAFEIHGNVTVKDGGYIYGHFIFAGERNTFFQIDNSSEPLGVGLTVRKTGRASVTLLARRLDLVLGVTVESGRLVLSPSCRLGFGAALEARTKLGKTQKDGMQELNKAEPREGYVQVRKGAVLEMQTGSSIGRIRQPETLVADLRIEGLLQIGRPGDPKGAPAVIELGLARGDGGFLGQHGGLYIRPTAEVKNFGKLVIRAPNGAAKTKADTGVSVFLEKIVDFGEVSFDHLRPGGIVARDPLAARKALVDATFGQHCAAKGQALFSKLELIDFKGGMGAVEFVDGLKTDCQILFPHAGRLMVRSKGNRIAQSFDLKSVCAVTIDGKRTEFHARRKLTKQEQELRKTNALWADVSGKGQLGKYADREWDEATLLIWRRPGVSGSRFVGSNWLGADGIPRFESPMEVDPNIDILLPAADSKYLSGGYGAGGMSKPTPNRHVTIERNATYGSSYNIWGNLWMKDASGLKGRQLGSFINLDPNVHRFLRFDGVRTDGAESSKYVIGHWGKYETGKGSTLEVIGKIRGSGDGLWVSGDGRLIMSENSYLTDGQRTGFYIQPKATVVLLQDARIGQECNMQQTSTAAVTCLGTLMIGLPERPITRDMLFPLAGIKREQINRNPGVHARASGAAFILSGEVSRLVIHSDDPAKARVVFKMYDSERAKANNRKWGVPDGINFYFAGKTELNGVLFDNVFEGGIMAPAAMRKNWKNVFYGKHNLAEPEKLHSDLKAEDNK
jgi:hypothetical protein